MNINDMDPRTRQRHACAAVAVAVGKTTPTPRLDFLGQQFCEAYLLGEYAGLTGSAMVANPYHAEMVIEKVFGIANAAAMHDDFLRRIQEA